MFNPCKAYTNAENDNSSGDENYMNSDGVSSNGARNSSGIRTLTRTTVVVMKKRHETTASGREREGLMSLTKRS